jgi:hypothetical protein
MEPCLHPDLSCCHPRGMLPMFIIPLVIIALHIMAIRYVALWFVLKKAGEPGWAAIIPVYNLLMIIKISGKPWWYILLFLIPIVNIVIMILILNGVSKNFGKGGWYTVGLIFFRTIFFAILGFGPAQYVGDKSRFNS